jgi:hypothetical protein
MKTRVMQDEPDQPVVDEPDQPVVDEPPTDPPAMRPTNLAWRIARWAHGAPRRRPWLGSRS